MPVNQPVSFESFTQLLFVFDLTQGLLGTMLGDLDGGFLIEGRCHKASSRRNTVTPPIGQTRQVHES